MDPQSTLPADVCELLKDRLDGFEQLRTLLHLRQGRDRLWSVDEIVAAIRLDVVAVNDALAHLAEAGFVQTEAKRFRYAPSNVELEATLERLQRAYDEDLAELLRVMSANALERLRTTGMRMFAEAFVLGRGRKDG